MLALSLAAALVAMAPGRAYESPSRLRQVAHAYSLGVGELRCASHAEWSSHFGASFGWAYTNLREQYAVLAPRICEGALNVTKADIPARQRALGVLVLVHEAFHLRRWRFRRDEDKVECQAVVHFKEATQRLGASADEAEGLYAYALAWHARQTRLYPRYRDPGCLIPPWNPPMP